MRVSKSKTLQLLRLPLVRDWACAFEVVKKCPYVVFLLHICQKRLLFLNRRSMYCLFCFCRVCISQSGEAFICFSISLDGRYAGPSRCCPFSWSIRLLLAVGTIRKPSMSRCALSCCFPRLEGIYFSRLFLCLEINWEQMLGPLGMWVYLSHLGPS